MLLLCCDRRLVSLKMARESLATSDFHKGGLLIKAMPCRHVAGFKEVSLEFASGVSTADCQPSMRVRFVVLQRGGEMSNPQRENRGSGGLA